ncbi:uncharacterized protein LOC131240008 isoform X2 [Magnolia sinica]|uniref:uncharacterized protein LOC131240008 isoform X2 n=1 Tax=Magnolia sinica TaxID=86752 RepID=UPI002658422E|nr:uncharacterized protein LOC131240008 isoform X2 [Magnolia sinica]
MHSKSQFPFLSFLFPIQTARFVTRRRTPSNYDQRSGIFGKLMANFVAEKLMLSKLRTVRWVTLFLGFSNMGVIVLGGILMIWVFPGCSRGQILPFVVVAVVAGIRIMSMIGTGIAQEATATTILGQQQAESAAVDAVIRHERRIRYKRWLWWTRFGIVITILQFVAVTYLMFIIVKYVSYDGNSSGCFLGKDTDSNGWKYSLLIFFLILAWLLVITQCFTGSDVLRWRSFYATHDHAWKAHYREVFDYGIREVLCCLGRAKYLSVLEEDEVHSVARLLGDLVAYRASGTGHLELLAGLALLQRHRQSTNLCEELMEAPESQIREAVTFHPFAEAAYTGPLLDVGRNPILFPCAWLWRQGVLTPWSRNRRPILEGDNWWRGHAAAFLKYVNLSPEALRRGRVYQAKREAAYFVVVLHHLRTVVIAVRGTETPEDLITDGLCRECPLLTEDVDGLINSEHISSDVRQSVLSSFPHYGHSGIVEAARELFVQIDGQVGDEGDFSSGTTGFLSSLLGAGCECQGYSVRIVGHSLGGAIATMLGLRSGNQLLHGSGDPQNYQDDSIVYNDEFSSRLSVSSILRLRAAAIAALSQDSSTNSAMVCNFARRILNLNKYEGSEENGRTPNPSFHVGGATADDCNHMYRRRHYKYAVKGGVFLCAHAVSCIMNMPNHRTSSLVTDKECELSSDIALETKGVSDKNNSAFNAGVDEPGQQLLVQEPTASFSDDPVSEILKDGFDEYSHSNMESPYSDITRDGLDNKFNKDANDLIATCIQPSFSDGISVGGSVSQLADGVSSSVEVLNGEHPEMFLPGLVIHMVPEKRSLLPLWKSWNLHDREHRYRAYLANRERFKDMIVSPYMFLDHLPWRCLYAMQRVLETHKAQQGQLDADLPNGSHIV